MIVAGQRLPILIATRPVDFRCGHQALALMVQTELKLDPHSGITVIFRSKRGDRLKILVWDGAGMVLTYKVLEQGKFACPCGCGDMVRIGEDRTERLDFIPARYQVIVTIRPKYACPKGRTGVVQARAPAHILEGSWPTEAVLAQIAMAKYSEHMPLNRQAVAMARLGGDRAVGAGRLDGQGRPYAYLRDLFTRLANGPLEKAIDALMPWACIPPAKASQ